jgi:hypothetical protein
MVATTRSVNVSKSALRPMSGRSDNYGADDRARTGDLDLGKVALYQLSYVRVGAIVAQELAPPNGVS